VVSGLSRAETEAAPVVTSSGTAAQSIAPIERPLADRLVAEAQAAEAAGNHAAAADALRRLTRERSLTLDELRWLAGQLDAAGDSAAALTPYYTLAAELGDDAATWERIGDLELQLGRPQRAAEAYGHVAPATRSSAVWVKVARAAAADGKQDAAFAAYDAALSRKPSDADAVSVEAARYALSANRPEYARRWTSAALAAGDRSIETRFAHAQALHMTGQPTAAAEAFRELRAEKPEDPRFVAWLARTSQAQGRHLEAYELFSDALAADPSADLLISRGDVAAQRDDTGRARADYTRARAAGADERIVSGRLDRLSDTPQLALPFEYLRDSNDVQLTTQTARVDLFTRGPFRLAVRGLSGRIDQRSTAFTTQSGAVDLDRWWLTPRLLIDGSAGFANVGSSTLPLWAGSARYHWPSGGSFALETTRQTPWSSDASRDLMRFNRIHDLAAVGSRFNATTFGARLNLMFGSDRALRTDVFSRDYSDGNRSRDVFVQFQQVIANGSAWVALQPHIYVEQWRSSAAAYYSPGTHVTTGLTLRSIAQRGIWSFDSALTPQLLSSNGNTGFGASLTGGIRARIFGGSIGANVMLFDDRRHAYGLRRIVADVRIPIGK
jgi:hypothetical protein